MTLFSSTCLAPAVVVTLRELRPLAGRTMLHVGGGSPLDTCDMLCTKRASRVLSLQGLHASAIVSHVQIFMAVCLLIVLQDPYGQVNPLYHTPVVDKMAVQPQKVSFVTPDGVKQVFMATTLM